MPINSRNKGAVGERELAEFLRERGYEARRGQQFHGGPGSPDVVCDGLGEFHFEVKRVEKTALYSWLDQAERDSGAKVPVVVHRRNRKKWVAILSLEDFLSLYVTKG